MNSNGKVAIVTGAGSGIGRAAALALLADGFSVVLAGRRREALLETIALARQQADSESELHPLAVPTDVTDVAAVEALFAQTVGTFGRLDVLFNNAGINTPAVPLEDLTLAQWQAVVDVNLTAAFVCTQQAFRIMKQQSPMGGRIINNGSISAYVPRPLSIAYTATKHAITGLTRSTSLDGRPYNIACGQIDIGNAETEMTGKVKQGVLQANGQTSAEPRMDVRHVGEAVLQMARLPLDANIQFMTLLATKMPYIGRG